MSAGMYICTPGCMSVRLPLRRCKITDMSRAKQGKRELLRGRSRMRFVSDKRFCVNQALLCVVVGRHLELMKTFPLYPPLSRRLAELPSSNPPAAGRLMGFAPLPVAMEKVLDGFNTSLRISPRSFPVTSWTGGSV